MNIGSTVASDSNSVEVVGTDSRLDISTFPIRVGFLSRDNSFLVKDGGAVSGIDMLVGVTAASASNNSVRVDGANSSITMANSIVVGPGANNSFVVTNAGKTVVTNAANTGFFNVQNGKLGMHGGTLLADQLLATNGASSILEMHGGIATVDTLRITSNAVFRVQLTGSGAGTGYGQVVATSGAIISNSVLDLIIGMDTTAGDVITLIDNQSANPTFGLFQGYTNNQFIDASANGYDAFFVFRYDHGAGANNVALLAVIPEPSTVMLAIGATSLLLLCRRKR